MCGRARCTLNPQQVARACGIQSDHNITTIDMDGFRPSYNVAPGASMPVVFRRNSGGGRVEDDDDGLARSGSEVVIQGMKWGLVPGFTKKTEKPDHFRMFNARSESIREKASFRRLVPGNRCLVAVEGFYEWEKDGSKKQPYYIHFKDQRPLVFAALYDSWKSLNGEILYTFTILTTCSSSCLKWLHDRMPVILGNKTSVAEWLGSSASELESVLRPYEGSDLVWYAVTPAIGKIPFNGPECVKELKLAKDNTITKFFSKKKDVEGTLTSEAEKPSSTNQSENLKEELFTKEIVPGMRFDQHDDETGADLSAIIKEEPCSVEDKKCLTTFLDSGIKIETEFSETPINKKPRDKEDNEWQEECRPAKSRKIPPSVMDSR